MARAVKESDPTVEKLDATIERLDAILAVLQNLLIFEGAKLGLTRDQVRRMVAVDNNRMSAVMSQVKKAMNRKETNGEDPARRRAS
jgi:hypothetical protein